MSYETKSILQIKSNEEKRFDQIMHCTNGGGCNSNTPPFSLLDETPAGAPWKGKDGDAGLNPLLKVQDIFGDSFCPDIEIHNCSYLYNPYSCGHYEIIKLEKMINDEGELVSNPYFDGSKVHLRLKFGISPGVLIREGVFVNWTV